MVCRMYMCTYIHFILAQKKYVCMYMQYPKKERAYSIGTNSEIFLSRRLIVV